jgi:hypothetical protein
MNMQYECVLVFGGKNLPNRKFDRIPIRGEVIIFGRIDDFYYVKEVYWREDGSAALALSKEQV